MKKNYLLFFVLTFKFAQSQWQSSVRLTNDMGVSQTSYNNTWCIASQGDTIHVVWYDDRDGNEEIYYKRSSDGGISWEADVRLTNDTAASDKPSIAITGNAVHIAWVDERDGNAEIYYKRSPNRGSNWTSDLRLTNDTAASGNPCIRAKGLEIHLVWEDARHGGVSDEIFYKRSTDGGKNWGTDVELTMDPNYSRYASLTMDGKNLHLAWFDDRDGNYEIYYKNSNDGGNNWNQDVRLTNDTAISIAPCIAISGSTIHITWTDYRDGSEDVFYKQSTDGGNTWGKDIQLTYDTGNSTKPSIAAEGSEVHIVWYDSRTGNPDIYYNHSLDGGNSWNTEENLSNNSLNSFLPSIVIVNSKLHVTWFDFSDGNREIYYKQYKPVGNTVGLHEISGENILNVYPNPANALLHFSCNNHINKNSTVSIKTLIGQTLYSSEMLNEENILDVSYINNGVYLFEISNEQEVIESRRIVIRNK